MEHLAEVCPVVQILDAGVPVPLLVEQYAEIWNLEEDILGAADLTDRDFQVPELVIEVAKIILDVIPLRILVPEPQIAEQLVEVLTPFFIFEQNVDIPVPQVGVARGGRQGFLSGQGSAGEQIVDIPSSGVLHGFLPGQVSTAFPGAEHGHDAPGHGALHGSRRGGGAVVSPQGSVPGQSSTARRVDAHVPDSSEWVQFVPPPRVSPTTGTDAPM